MHTSPRLALVLAGLCTLALPAAWADAPRNMTVQGRLTDGAGDPVAPGLKIFTFKIFDAEAAKVFGLTVGQITVMIHSGSRGLGYQVCEDAIHELREA